jgi:hypothetical protein
MLPVIVGAVVLLLSGVVQGVWTDRWTVSAAVTTACQRLATVPASVGGWEGRPLEIDERQLAVSETAGHVARKYIEPGSNRTMDLLVLCGRSGPMSVHQPDICYTGAGYQLSGPPVKWTVPGSESDTFWVARFTKPGHEAAPLRIFWAWSSDGAWTAADEPRLEFARRPALYKLYLVQRMTRPDEPLEEGPGPDFLRVLLPELRRCLTTDCPTEQPVSPERQ